MISSGRNDDVHGRLDVTESVVGHGRPRLATVLGAGLDEPIVFGAVKNEQSMFRSGSVRQLPS